MSDRNGTAAETPRRAPRVTVATAGLAAVALVALGLLAGILLAPEQAPSSVNPPPGERAVAISSRIFDDARRVTVTPTLAEAVTLTLTETGRVTRTACAPAAVITSGTSPVTIDDRPIVALSTHAPLWRDLGRGSRGKDVRALQVELARLGYEVAPNGTYDRPTQVAVTALQNKVGVAQPSGRLPVASVIWLPAPQVTVATCEVALAQHVSAGAFATVAGGLQSLKVSDGLAGAVAGDRVLRYREESAPIDAGGMVTDPAFLAAVAAGPEFALATAPQGGSLTLVAALATPLHVAVVPPAAIVEIAEDTGCVLADGQARRVRVVASSLGQTMVIFDGGDVPARVDLVAAGEMRPSCA